MKNPFSKSKKDEQEHGEEDDIMPENLSIAQLEKRTVEIEAAREEKRLAREEKKFLKEQAAKRQRLERWIAPFLLFVTFLFSFLIYMLAR
jgi:hypothetical protein